MLLPCAGLSESEINAILSRLQKADPEAFAGKNVTELRQELASIDLSELGMDPSGLSAATKLKAVTSELLDGLNEAAGAPGPHLPRLVRGIHWQSLAKQQCTFCRFGVGVCAVVRATFHSLRGYNHIPMHPDAG